VADSSRKTAPQAIAAVVVTYDSRWTYLEPTLEAALSQSGVTRLIVVDNGSPAAVGDRLAALATRDNRLTVVRHEENLGSAGGFRSGLAAASATTARFVWTLDDDTRPEPGAAAALIETWNALKAGRAPEVRALASQRWDAGRYRREGRSSVNAAFGVDLLQRARRLAGADDRTGAADEEILVRMAPWSGLFFERVWLDRVGLPDERLVLYEDDHEFTLRLTAGGGGILVVPRSRLVTLAPSWHESRPAGFLTPWLATSDPWRAYYCARNRVYLERRRLVTNPVRHGLNLAAFALRVALAGVAAGSLRNTHWFLAGVIDGWRGRLGPRTFPPQEGPSSPFTRKRRPPSPAAPPDPDS
jgi:GT2 family glycosyltransferase